jgi:hypothetical protein
MSLQTAPPPVASPPRRESLRGRLLPFTGLLPVLLMVPVLAFNLYAVAIVLALASGVAVIAYHLSRGQGVTSLDVLLLGFAAVNAILYLGFDEPILLDHIDAVIYTALAAQATWSLRYGEPWTTQFTRRVLPPEAWTLPEFAGMNRFSTALWAGCFAACDVVAIVAGHPWRLYVPIALMLGVAVASRRGARLYLAHRLGVAADDLPAPWNGVPADGEGRIVTGR